MRQQLLLFIRKSYFTLSIISILPFFASGEGTKQLLPDSTISGAGLYIDNSPGTVYTNFAVANCPANYRLYIHVKNSGEYILFGFESIYMNIPFTLRKPNGTVALSGIVPYTTGQTGYIQYYHQAIVGPYPSYGGYIPLSYQITSSADTGNYYFEIPTSVTYAVIFDMWDFQVVSGQHNPAIPSDAINGRVWSQSWQLYASLGYSPSDYQPFNGSFYVYADDGIVTKLAFSNAAVGAVTIFCNPYGCLNTGNFQSDRQSNNNNTFIVFPGIAQYKVFLNNPDSTVYPSGFYGEILGTPYMIPDTNYPPCSREKIIVVNVDKLGKVQMNISFPYGAPATNVSLYANVVPGTNYIPWNGLDGLGNAVPDGTQISVNVQYMNGLTNLPVWDQEMNPDGYIITLVRPANTLGLQPPSFWDDSQLVPNNYGDPCNNPPQTVNLTGCTPGSIPGYPGCHPWQPVDGYCHNKMINTWWYGSTSNSSFSCMFNGIVPTPIGHGASHCGPGSLLLHATVLNNETVDWYNVPSGGTPILIGDTSFNTPFITVTTTYYAEARNDSSGCESALRKPVVATINPLPVPIITGQSSLCAGVTGNIYTTQSGMTNYNWTVSAGGIITGGGTSTSNTITVTWTVPGAQTVSVNYTNIYGCRAANSTIFNVTVNPLPSPTITGPAAVCAGTTGNVYTTESGMANYNWTVSSGGIITAGGTSTNNTVTITWNNTGSQTVSVNYFNSSGCTAVTSTIYNVTVNPLPVPSIFGPMTMCAGTTGNIYTTQSGMTNYNWSVSSGGIITGGGTSTSNTVTITWIMPGTQTVSVNYFNAFGCTAINATIFNITVNSLPVPSITGPVSSCIGTTNNVYNTQPGMNNYTWNVSAGGTITAGGTSTSNTVTVTWNTPGLQTVSVNYTNGNGCRGMAPALVNVNIYPLPVPSLAGPTLPCVGSTGNVYSTAAGMSDYMWSVSQGGTILSGGTSTDNSVTIVWNTSGSQSVSVNYTDTHGCEALTPSTLIINVEPLPVPTISGPASPCIFSTDNNYITEPGMTSYIWTISSGGTITSGLGTNSITVTWNAAGPQNVSVIYTDQNGCTPGMATFYYVTVNPLPGSPGNIIGPSPICSGSKGLVYTVSAVTDAVSYTWILPVGFSIVSGNGTNTITVDADSNAFSGTILVYATNLCGDGQPSPPFPVIVNTLPTGNAGPDGFTCQIIPFTITQASASNYAAIQWYSSGTGMLTGATTLSPTYTPAQGEIGPVTLTLIMAGNAPCGNDTSKMVLDIEPKAIVNAGSDLVTCGQNPVLLTGSSASDYQSLLWTTNGSGIFNDPTILHPTYTPSLSDVNAGIVFLTLHATSTEPCEPDSSRVLLTIARPVYVYAGPDSTVCQYQPFTLNKAIANSYSTITWSTTGDGTFNDSTIVNPVYSPGTGDILQGKAILIITAQGINQCSPATDSIVLTIIRKPTVHPGPDGAICQGMTYIVTGVTATDYSNFIWAHNGQGVLSETTTFSPIYTPGPGETGTVIMTLNVFGNPSCHDSGVSCQMKLKIYTPVLVNAGEDQTISYDTVAIIHAEATGGSGDYKFEWQPSSLVQDDTARETQTLSLKYDTVFIVTITDKVTGCSSSDSIKIYMGPGEGLEGCIVIYNVITPNGDGLNDTWIIDCIENFPDNTVQIFNRWGEMVNNYYHYDNKTQVWDGTNYNGELLPDGTYYYVLKIKNERTMTGWILLRGGIK